MAAAAPVPVGGRRAGVGAGVVGPGVGAGSSGPVPACAVRGLGAGVVGAGVGSASGWRRRRGLASGVGRRGLVGRRRRRGRRVGCAAFWRGLGRSWPRPPVARPPRRRPAPPPAARPARPLRPPPGRRPARRPSGRPSRRPRRRPARAPTGASRRGGADALEVGQLGDQGGLGDVRWTRRSAPACASAAAASARAWSASRLELLGLGERVLGLLAGDVGQRGGGAKASYLLSRASSAFCMVVVRSIIDSMPSEPTRAAKPWSSGLILVAVHQRVAVVLLLALDVGRGRRRGGVGGLRGRGARLVGLPSGHRCRPRRPGRGDRG